MEATLISLLLCLSADPAPDTLVICPPQFAGVMRPWLDYRKSQGHRIELLANQASSHALREAIRAASTSDHLQYIVLVGDALPMGFGSAADRQRTTPTHWSAASVITRWGPEVDIASDNWYADLDDDLLPDVAVGRLPADNSEQLRVMIRKILDYEQRAIPGLWKRRINLVAGVGDFGPLLDTVIEAAAKKFLTDGIPPAYATSMTYGCWRSPYCPNPTTFPDIAQQRFNEGCLFWVYLGHGQRYYLDHIRFPGSQRSILSTQDVGRLRQEGGAPISVFLSCYSGAFDGRRDSLGEVMMQAPEGPVAVFAGSRVTMPYGMAVMGNELMHEYFVARRETLGQLILHAKRDMAASASRVSQDQITTRQWLDALATWFSPQPDRLNEERLEHIQLFNLLGDPLMRLPQPGEVRLEVPDRVHAGERLIVRGTTSLAGRLTLELVCRRDHTRETPPVRASRPESDEQLAGFTCVYEAANDPRWASISRECQAGQFSAELLVPVEARGPSHVRAFIDGPYGHALGACPLRIEGPHKLQRMAERPSATRQ